MYLTGQLSQVFIVTGGASGVGFELVKLLYQNGGTVYVAARSQERASKAIDDVRVQFPRSKGRLFFLFLDLSDLAGIRKAAEEFMARERTLHVLWNNAGVALPPDGSKTKQVHSILRSLRFVGKGRTCSSAAGA